MSQPLDGQHFDNLAANYDRYRSLDEAPVEYIVAELPNSEHTVCDLGCGTGRWTSGRMGS